MSDLLHDALRRAQQQSNSPSLTAAQLKALSLGDDSDDDLIEVRTPGLSPSVSAFSTPAHSRSTSPTRESAPNSRSTTPGGSKRRGGAGKPRRDKTKEREKAEANKNSIDPLVKFPGEVNVKIFGDLGFRDLLACGLVSKRWRQSQTINWAWYCLLESITYVTPSASTGSKLPTWRKGDSKIDWSARFASIHRQDDVPQRESSDVDDEGKTFQEEREEKWKEENDEAATMDKAAMREYYKGLRNAKVKGKTGKGMARTWDEDGLGGGGDDYM